MVTVDEGEAYELLIMQVDGTFIVSPAGRTCSAAKPNPMMSTACSKDF